MKSKNKHGGARPGSGAKEKQDKKIAVFAWVLGSDVTKVGGKDSAKTIAEKAIQTAARKCV